VKMIALYIGLLSHSYILTHRVGIQYRKSDVNKNTQLILTMWL